MEAAETNAYLRNRTAVGPLIDGKPSSPKEAFTGQKPSIDHVRVWGCKVYLYVDPRSLPVRSRHDKLMDRGRVGVFMGYMDETDKQYRLWAPNLGRVIRTHSIRFIENKKGGDIDLNLKVKAKSNVVPKRRQVDRPQKILFTPEPAKEEREDSLVVEEKGGNINLGQHPLHQETPPTTANKEDQPRGQQATLSSALGTGRFRGVFIPKRKRSLEEEPSAEEPALKVPRSLFALISQTPIKCYKPPEV